MGNYPLLGGNCKRNVIAQITLPIVVRNANRAPEIADISNAFVDKGSVLEIPISAPDAPQITSMKLTDNGKKIEIEGFSLKPSNDYGSIYAWLRPEGSGKVWRDDLPGQLTPVIEADGTTSFAWEITAQATPTAMGLLTGSGEQKLVIDLSANPGLSAAKFTLAMHELVLVRVDRKPPIIPLVVSEVTRTIIGAALPIEGPSSATLVSDGRNIRIYQKLGETDIFGNSVTTVRTIPLVDENNIAIFAGGYKADQIAMSPEGDVAFIAGMKGQIYVFDMVKLAVTKTINIAGATGQNISSLAVSQGWLYASIGGRYSTGAGQLFRINIAPYHYETGTGANKITQPCPLFTVWQIQIPADTVNRPAGTQGYFDLAISNDGRYLAVTESRQKIGLYGWEHKDRGNAFVIDLDGLSIVPDAALKPVNAAVKTILGTSLPANTAKGYGAQYIAPGSKPGEFIISTAKDYTAGAFLAETVDNDPQSANYGKFIIQTDVATNLKLTPPPEGRKWFEYGAKYVLDIQRASGVVVTADDKYAFVSDYYMAFNESNWLGGSLVGKQAGGKIGIIKDPFGTPVFMGTTTPIVGASIERLMLSADGSQLIADLKDWGVNLTGAMTNGILVWDVGQLITEAENNSFAEQGTSKAYVPIDRTSLFHTQTVTPDRYNDTGYIFGMASTAVTDIVLSEPPVMLDNSKTLSNGAIRFGDVGRFDLKKAVSKFLDDSDHWWTPLINQITGAAPREITDFMVLKDPANASLVTNAAKRDNMVDSIRTKDIVTDTMVTGNTTDKTFDKTGVLYLAPEITNEELTILRAGGKLPTKLVELVFQAKVDGQVKVFRLKVNASDYASAEGAVFFGDRDLENPGYSAFKLSGEVSVDSLRNATTDEEKNRAELDIWRVEQRLKYLGFPAMGTGTGNTIKVFKVDGNFSTEEQHALKLFEKVVRYDGGGAGTARYNETSPGADGMIEADANNVQAKLTTGWLNAYNAPHWMQYFASIDNPNGAQFADSNPALPGWKNDQLGQAMPNINRRLTAVEVFGTSWIRDLMVAKQYAPANWVQPDSTLTGTVDANYGYTVGGHHTHDLGMAMDLGITHYIDYDIQKLLTGNTPSQIVVSVPTSGQWSMADAQALLDAMINVPKNRQDLALADFFSLYAVTQNGTARDALATHVSNATALNALFGDGTQANGLINGVIIGGTTGSMNTYPDMRYAMQQLGFREGAVPQANTLPSLQNMTVHYNHFHIYLQPPELEPIHTTNALMVADAGNATGLVTSSDPLMLADAAAKTITPEIVRKINKELANSCSASENPSYSQNAALGGLSSGAAVVGLLKYKYGIEVSGEVKAVIIQQPAHGKIAMIGLDTRTFPGLSLEVFEYTPEKDFLGNDKAVIEVTANGQKFRLSYTIKVVHGGFNDACMPPGADNGTLVPDVQIAIDDIQFLQDAGAPEVATSWQSLFAQNEQIINSINLSFADLAGGAVGQTIGEGPNATITLDTNAAGHNWYIDTTPADNSEYLATSNPYEWVAKEGSAAYGKMDMLSVLLHEYGHALGIDHSADSHDYMGTTLTVGVRRLPSADELALMQQLIGAAKGEMVANASTPTPTLPLQGGGGLPIPLGAGFGIAFLGRMRKSSYGGSSIDVVGAPSITQYAVAANATFTNLATPAGWNSQGSVDIASGTATLSEVSTSQTRLSQVFMLGEQDRYLSFTLSGTALDDLTGAPDDAFEVALLDANTGLSALGGNGLTRTDAFLNLQGDGTQNAAQSVTRIDNADGSRTYRVDLTGVAKNTAVNLSFDLLGFGQDNSHITLRDIRVSGLPQLRDDVATIAEDNLLTFDPFAQADTQLKPLLAAHIVTAPTHGALVMNADGTFSYTPDLDYFGTDSFSYRLSDGPLDSNLATVSLTVTPVNDAPVVADVQATTAEDTALVIDLFAYATDVETPSPIGGGLGWGSFTTQIVTGPQHGVLVANADGTYNYTPDANYFGTDSFTYKANDGELDSNIATVSLNVTPVNDAPVAVDTQAATDEDTPLSLNLLAAASDIDGDGDVLTPVIIAGPLHGQLVSNPDGTFTYTPDANYNGSDSFTYQVNDGFVGAQFIAPDSLSSNIVTVSLTIAAVNDAPVAVSATVTGKEDTPYIFGWSDFKVSDVDSVDTSTGLSTGLAITINTLPANGLLQLYDGIQWTAVLAGQRVTKADIDAGWLCFGPGANQSGFSGYSTAGFGNLKSHYASFTYQADDGFLTSAMASMTVNIIPVADAPALMLAGAVDAWGATALRFSTGWETVSNLNPTSTVLPQSELEGWRAIMPTGDSNNHFIVWSSGDKMKDAGNTNRIVYAAANPLPNPPPQAGEGANVAQSAAQTLNGNNWIELADSQGNGHETWGIERTVDTRAGVTYNLSLDYAGRLGYTADFTTIGIYVDGVRIATHAGTSSNTALNWEALNFSFTGSGAAQTIRIVTEATSSQSNGRGAMIDNITLTEYMPINTGYQDSAIRLSAVIAALTDIDGSETIGVTVGAIPTGATLSDGTNSFTATDTMHIVAVTDWNLSTLAITAPAGYTGSFALTVAATSMETATSEVANSAITLPVTVVPTNVTSPLVIDLNGDGVQTTALGATQGKFDLLNNGHAINSGWASAQDGFLAIDSNGNGLIDDRSELFGGAIGEGYAKLAGFDSNRDGVVNAKDARYRELKVWQDANGNRRTDAGELQSLAERGINGLNVNYEIAPEVQNGNWLLERSKVTFKDGHTAEMADAYFEIGQHQPTSVRPEPVEGQSNETYLGIPDDKTIRNKLGAVAEQFFAERKLYAPAIDWSAQAPSPFADDAKKKQKVKTSWLSDFLGINPPPSLAESTGLNVTMPKTEEAKQPFVERRQRASVAPDGTKLTNER